MANQVLQVMEEIDALGEDLPSESFDRLLQRPPLWFPDRTDDVEVALSRILDGMWLYLLGDCCPESRKSVIWRGVELTVEEEDLPLGYTLQMAGIEIRDAGCRLASHYATPDRLARVRATEPPDRWPFGDHMRAVALRWMEQLALHLDDDIDWFGSPLPATVKTISALHATSVPYRKQGNTSVVTSVSVRRQPYFIKQLIQPGPLLTLLDGFQIECAVLAVFNALPWQIAPHTGCLFVADDGTLSFLSNKVGGIAMVDIPRAAGRVSLRSVQVAVLAEWLVNAPDRHEGNIFIDRSHAQPWLIDFAPALDPELLPLELPDVALSMDEQREAFTRALWTWHPESIKNGNGEIVILDEVLAGFVQARRAALDALARFPINTQACHAVEQRFRLLERLAQMPGDHSVEALNRLLAA